MSITKTTNTPRTDPALLSIILTHTTALPAATDHIHTVTAPASTTILPAVTTTHIHITITALQARFRKRI